VSPEADRDGRDAEATHVVAIDDGQVIGTCRLVFRGTVARLGRLAVEPDARRRGVAAAILDEAAAVAGRGAAERISLHAQTYARDLYVRAGYVETGAPFEEEGIEHVAMERTVA
jgi:predicted GNAT family N-acyltransferase